MKYDLEDRTARFAENVIEFVKGVKRSPITLPLITQLVKSATSVGANYREANGACSRKDFKNKAYICKKEIKETEYWFQMISKAEPQTIEKSKELITEARELVLIFSKIVATASKEK